MKFAACAVTRSHGQAQCMMKDAFYVQLALPEWVLVLYVKKLNIAPSTKTQTARFQNW